MTGGECTTHPYQTDSSIVFQQEHRRQQGRYLHFTCPLTCSLRPVLVCYAPPNTEVQTCKSSARLSDTHSRHTAALRSNFTIEKRHVVCLLGIFIKPEHYVIILMMIPKHWRLQNNWNERGTWDPCSWECGGEFLCDNVAKSLNQQRPWFSWTMSGYCGDNESSLASSQKKTQPELASNLLRIGNEDKQLGHARPYVHPHLHKFSSFNPMLPPTNSSWKKSTADSNHTHK